MGSLTTCKPPVCAIANIQTNIHSRSLLSTAGGIYCVRDAKGMWYIVISEPELTVLVKDILQAWCFWRRSTPKANPEKKLQRSQSELSLNGGLKDFEIVA